MGHVRFIRKRATAGYVAPLHFYHSTSATPTSADGVIAQRPDDLRFNSRRFTGATPTSSDGVITQLPDDVFRFASCHFTSPTPTVLRPMALWLNGPMTISATLLSVPPARHLLQSIVLSGIITLPILPTGIRSPQAQQRFPPLFAPLHRPDSVISY